MKSNISEVLMTETRMFELGWRYLRNAHLLRVGLRSMDQGYIVYWWLDPTHLQKLLYL